MVRDDGGKAGGVRGCAPQPLPQGEIPPSIAASLSSQSSNKRCCSCGRSLRSQSFPKMCLPKCSHMCVTLFFSLHREEAALCGINRHKNNKVRRRLCPSLLTRNIHNVEFTADSKAAQLLLRCCHARKKERKRERDASDKKMW